MFKSPFTPPLDDAALQYFDHLVADLPRVSRCDCQSAVAWDGGSRRAECKPDPLCLRLNRVFTAPIRLDRTGAA
jgi:hypothetical protein